MTNRLIVLFGSVLALSCASRHQQDDEIYELMKFVIKDQKLNLENGLSSRPDTYIFNELSDLKSTKVKIQNVDSTEIDVEGYKLRMPSVIYLEYCENMELEDIDYMLSAPYDTSFRWDNGKLKFNRSNDSSWYSISLPVFSKDKSKAVMTIRNLCRGLCGHGWVVCLRKEQNNWVAETGQQWMH